MFSVSFFIVLRKFSTHPKPQVFREGGRKNTLSKPKLQPQVLALSGALHARSLHASSSCLKHFILFPVPLKSQPLGMSQKFWVKLLPLPFPSVFVPPLESTSTTSLCTFPFYWAITRVLWSMKWSGQPHCPEIQSPIILPLQGSRPLNLVVKAPESGGPGFKH